MPLIRAEKAEKGSEPPRARPPPPPRSGPAPLVPLLPMCYIVSACVSFIGPSLYFTADDTLRRMVEKGLCGMTHQVEYLALQLIRTNEGDKVEVVNGKRSGYAILGQEITQALEELAKAGWEVATSYSAH